MRRILVASALAIALIASACSDDAETPPTTSAAPIETTVAPTTTTRALAPAGEHYAVGEITETLVDTSRPTARNGSVAAKPARTLPTTFFYPAEGAENATVAVANAPPATGDGPFPLLVFAHGFTATPDVYRDLLVGIASAGYVVAAPAFPLTNGNADGGANAADYVNQPADLSFVITETLAASAADDGALAAMVAPDAIAAAGHSEGAITTMGLAVNTCCLDDRVKAAVILAGSPQEYEGGGYDFDAAPPLLFVHGTNDALLPYSEAVAFANQALPPKGFLTLEGADHSSWVRASDGSFAIVLQTTIDFLDAYLRDDAAAKAGLVDASEGGATLRFAPNPGDTMTIPTVAPAVTDRQATVTPSTGLTNGQEVTVTWSGYLPGQSVNIVQCSGGETDIGVEDCEISAGKVLVPDPIGSGTTTLVVIVGAVGVGQCGPGTPTCTISVNDSGITDPAATVRIPISFA